MRRADRFRPVMLALVPSFALFSGCVLEGDNAPGDGADPVVVSEADEEIAEGVAGSAIEILSGMFDAVSSVDEPAGTLREESVTWDGTAGVWTITASDAYDEPDASGTAGVTYTVQFWAGSAAQQYVDDFTDAIDITANATNVGNFHPEGRAFDLDYDFTVQASFHATISQGIVSATGAGTLDGTTDTHIGDATVSRVQDGDWTWQFSIDTNQTDACPVGSLQGTVNAFAFTGSLDGGVVVYEIRRNGDLVRTVTTDYSCGEDSGGV